MHHAHKFPESYIMMNKLKAQTLSWHYGISSLAHDLDIVFLSLGYAMGIMTASIIWTKKVSVELTCKVMVSFAKN